MAARADNGIHEQGKALKRRGILAAAGVAVAALVAKQTAQPVAASSPFLLATTEASGVLNGPVLGPTFLYDTNNGYTSSESMITVSCINGPALAALRGTTFGVIPFSTTGPLPPEKCGVYGDTDVRVGVLGASSSSGVGVRGRILSVSTATDTVAVDGVNAASAVRGIGVRGDCDGAFGVGVQGLSSSYYGVQGSTDSGIGVVGDVKAGGTGTSNIGVLGRVGVLVANSQPKTYAVYGQNLSTGANGTGVLGQSDLVTGTGVKGVSGAGFPIIGNVTGTGSATNPAAGVLGSGTVGPGMQGQSTGGHGLVGTTDARDGHAGLIGNATHAGGIGLMGIAPGYGTGTVGLAGDFYGNVKINGGTLSAPVMQAVVLHTGDNGYRTLHHVASPEGWIEDFGEAKLTNSTADVKLDPDFAALVETSGYHVYLTEYGDHNNLFVATRSADGFVVQAKEPAAAVGTKAPTKAVHGTFGYRVVAKRKDIKSERLAKVAAPAAPARPAPLTIPETTTGKA